MIDKRHNISISIPQLQPGNTTHTLNSGWLQELLGSVMNNEATLKCSWHVFCIEHNGECGIRWRLEILGILESPVIQKINESTKQMP